LFISFEGIDKVGKSTQISLLGDYLRRKKYQVVQTCEPGGTRLGKEIERILLGKQSFFSILLTGAST
jgi:dTMP kinase